MLAENGEAFANVGNIGVGVGLNGVAEDVGEAVDESVEVVAA
jgi:hypothetical protein